MGFGIANYSQQMPDVVHCNAKFHNRPKLQWAWKCWWPWRPTWLQLRWRPMCIGQCPMSHVQGHSGGDLASSLRYLKILSLRSTFPPLRSLLWTSSLIYRVAEVERGYGGSPPKSLDLDENFKPEFCRELRFVTINALFGDLWPKKVPFWVKNSVSWARSVL